MHILVEGSIVLYVVIIFFVLTKIQQNEWREEKERKYRDVLLILEIMVAKIGSFELIRNGDFFKIVFHTLEEVYLRRCANVLEKTIPYISEETRIKLTQLQSFIYSSICEKEDLYSSLIQSSFKKDLSDAYDEDLKRQKERMRLSGSCISEKKFHRQCNKYLKDRASIKKFFDDTVALLHAELS